MALATIPLPWYSPLLVLPQWGPIGEKLPPVQCILGWRMVLASRRAILAAISTGRIIWQHGELVLTVAKVHAAYMHYTFSQT